VKTCDRFSTDRLHRPDLRFTLSADYPRNPLPYYLRTDLVDHQRLGEKFAEADDGDDGQDGNGVYTFRGWGGACAPGDPLNHGVEIAENPRTSLDLCSHVHVSMRLQATHRSSSILPNHYRCVNIVAWLHSLVTLLDPLPISVLYIRSLRLQQRHFTAIFFSHDQK
jgi:hypothetical protein